MRRRIAGACVVAVLAGTAVGTAFAAQSSTDAKVIGWGSRSTGSVETPHDGSRVAPRITNALTIRTVLRIGSFKTFDVGPVGLSAGDSYVFGGPLYDRTDTERVGFLSGSCVTTNPGYRALASCTVTANPNEEGPSPASGDQITLQGWNDNTPYPFKQAVTGGTGIYRNVRGEVIAIPGDTFRVIFRLLP